MSEKVLFVDDEQNILDSYRRSLRKILDVDTALGGQEALEIMRTKGPFAVVVSDMRMPGMNGVEFLAESKRLWPDTVRLMLTGNSDQQTAIDAVNIGDIYRFLNKPCEPQEMARAVFAAINHHRLITAEKELLENTLAGSIGVLSDVLSMVNPEAFGKTTRIKRLVRAVATHMKLENIWQYETMASLSQIGCVILPEEILAKHSQGFEFSEEERQLFDQQSSVGAHLLSKIPRLDDIANSVLYQGKNFDGGGVPHDSVAGTDIPMGARLLKIILDYDAYQTRGHDFDQCLARIEANRLWYDPDVLLAFRAVLKAESSAKTVRINISQLEESMVVAEDVATDKDLLVVCNGQEVSSFVIERLAVFHRNHLIPDTILVYCPEGAELTEEDVLPLSVNG